MQDKTEAVRLVLAENPEMTNEAVARGGFSTLRDAAGSTGFGGSAG